MVKARPSKLTGDEQLADWLATCYDDPLRYVMGCFPWASNESIQQVKLEKKYRRRYECDYGPDVWACEFLDILGDEIRKRKFDGKHAVDPILFETVSGHGIGKTVLVSWLIKFIMDTRPFAKGVVTATTVDQLKTKTWAELGKWHKLSLTEHWFKYSAGRGSMCLIHKTEPERWRCDAHTCREENSEAFAGLHSASSTPFYIFDEASGVPDKIFEVREGGLTDGEPMVFDFGNPTKNSGRFFENTAGRFKHRYMVRRIDSRDVAITNKRQIRKWLDDYGVDSDFFRVRVRGLHPNQGDKQLIPSQAVKDAMDRELTQQIWAPLVLGVDVARSGKAESVIYPRRGRDARTFPPKRFRGLDTVQLTGKVIETVREFRLLGLKVVTIFVDGGGLGGGVVDQLRAAGYPVEEVFFSSRSVRDPKDNYFLVDQLWCDMRDAIKQDLCLPEFGHETSMELERQLTCREYDIRKTGQLSVVPKDMMEDEGQLLDIADALALTYAKEIHISEEWEHAVPYNQHNQHYVDFDPIDYGLREIRNGSY